MGDVNKWRMFGILIELVFGILVALAAVLDPAPRSVPVASGDTRWSRVHMLKRRMSFGVPGVSEVVLSSATLISNPNAPKPPQCRHMAYMECLGNVYIIIHIPHHRTHRI